MHHAWVSIVSCWGCVEGRTIGSVCRQPLFLYYFLARWERSNWIDGCGCYFVNVNVVRYYWIWCLVFGLCVVGFSCATVSHFLKPSESSLLSRYFLPQQSPSTPLILNKPSNQYARVCGYSHWTSRLPNWHGVLGTLVLGGIVDLRNGCGAGLGWA